MDQENERACESLFSVRLLHDGLLTRKHICACGLTVSGCTAFELCSGPAPLYTDALCFLVSFPYRYIHIRIYIILHPGAGFFSRRSWDKIPSL